jgi:hypothetical protein
MARGIVAGYINGSLFLVIKIWEITSEHEGGTVYFNCLQLLPPVNYSILAIGKAYIPFESIRVVENDG